MNSFQGGAIYWSPSTGAHVVYGAVAAKYNSVGGAAAYGLPTSDEAYVAGVPGVRVSNFQGGRDIYWSSATGAHLVYGAIDAAFVAAGTRLDAFSHTVRQVLGAPTSDERDVPGVPGARMNSFQGGVIYWSPTTGAHAVYGAMLAKYIGAGGPTAYGLPTSDEGDTGLPGLRHQSFQGGRAIYWSQSTGAHLVYGDILNEYVATTGEHDAFGRALFPLLGAPTSDEVNVPGVAGARMNTFQGGVIYWSQSTGAHVVYGAILAKYNSIGGPRSFLGLPTSDEMDNTGGGRVSYFQHGKIVWTSDGGAVVTG
jgi:uncharacterized protein with LGFP repeats